MASLLINRLINETKLDSSVPQHLISLEGHTWVSKDRNRFGGGVSFYIRNSINFQVRSDSGLWQMFRTFVLRRDWSILRILKSTKKHERQSERVTLASIYNNIFRLYHN